MKVLFKPLLNIASYCSLIGAIFKSYAESRASKHEAQKMYIGYGCSSVDIRGETPIAALAMNMGIDKALAACFTSNKVEFPMTMMLKLAAVPNLVIKKISGNRKPP